MTPIISYRLILVPFDHHSLGAALLKNNFFRLYEEKYAELSELVLEEIEVITGCLPPCTYRTYNLAGITEELPVGTEEG